MGESKKMVTELRQSLHKIFHKNQKTSNGDTEVVETLREYYIPLPEAEKSEECNNKPECPVIVFTNSKSGGQLGGELLATYHNLLNPNQMFDLGEKKPEKVLHQLYLNLERHKRNGDGLASDIHHRLRIIVAGGDGTAGWILGVISDIKLSKSPPVATMPLGTGNNLPFSFGWGKKNPGTDHQSVNDRYYHL